MLSTKNVSFLFELPVASILIQMGVVICARPESSAHISADHYLLVARLRPKLSEAVTHSLKPRSFCGSDRVARPAWTPRRPLIESPKAKDIFDQFGAVGLYDETHIIVERHFQEKLKALPSKLQTIFSSTVKSIADHPPTVN